MTNKDIERAVDEFVRASDYTVFELVSLQKPHGAEEAIAKFVCSLVSRVYEEAEQALSEYCHCGVSFLSGETHKTNCPLIPIRRLRNALMRKESLVPFTSVPPEQLIFLPEPLAGVLSKPPDDY